MPVIVNMLGCIYISLVSHAGDVPNQHVTFLWKSFLGD